MKEVFLALIAGIIVGLVFKLIRLPLPAPPVLAGVMGIVGVYLGGVLADKIMSLF
ncbi:XapX domain-containing protein [Caldalkalibacillus salinus]|uniref:XapX domain-containing protein n=1 Tax=Caldalkalibacillus salinus TaxID=2803787 RepID=UPI001921BBA7|nr:XapX domain-containing protein [Caldalkalibacillus salinus]